jgi:hypothetical protein
LKIEGERERVQSPLFPRQVLSRKEGERVEKVRLRSERRARHRSERNTNGILIIKRLGVGAGKNVQRRRLKWRW